MAKVGKRVVPTDAAIFCDMERLYRSIAGRAAPADGV